MTHSPANIWSRMQSQPPPVIRIQGNIRPPATNIRIQQQPQVPHKYYIFQNWTINKACNNPNEQFQMDWSEWRMCRADDEWVFFNFFLIFRLRFYWFRRGRSKLYDTVHIHATTIGRHTSGRCSCQWYTVTVSRTRRIITRGKTTMISETLWLLYWEFV